MVEIVFEVLAAVYVMAGVALSIFVGSFALIIVIYLLKRRQPPIAPQISDDELLSVTVQLPVYNEQFVVGRLIDAVCQMDYPHEKFHVQILDDSTDETLDISRERAAYWREQGVNCEVVRREKREGYKAGALAYGMQLIDSDCIAVFDADFVPPVDFLRRTMPHFNTRQDIALVQTRWAHLNLDYNWLTRAQAINMDGHFGIEQVARSRGYLPMTMNGTGGIWRVSAIEDAGGWSAATLTEDLDLSYRAMMKGWRFIYLVDVPVPGELPPQVAAWKVQQARWATGNTQCLIRHAVPLMRSKQFPWWKKFMGLMHLSQYAVQLLIFTIFFLTPILLAGNMFGDMPNLWFMGVVGIIPPLMLIMGQLALYRYPTNLLYFPFQVVAGTAMVLTNSIAVIKALNINKIQEFKRTPKYRVNKKSDQWTVGKRYALKFDWTTIAELLLAGYALIGFALALRYEPALAPYQLIYAVAFISFAFWNYYQTWKLSR